MVPAFFDFIIKATMWAAFLSFIILLPQFLLSIKMGFSRDKFNCQQCGNCCRLKIIDLSKEDVERLEKGGYKDFTEMKAGEVTFKRVNGRCLFNKNDKCTVYEHRAAICREFPFFWYYGVVPYCRIMSYCPAQDELKKKLKWI